MKKLILFLFALFCFQVSNASHVVSAEIWYEHDTLNDYIIHLKVFRDCNGISIGPTALVSVTGGAASSLTLNQDTVYNLYACTANSCTNPASTATGYEVHKFSAPITLPPSNNWKFSYTTCCRVPNQTGPAANITVVANLDNVSVPFNNMAFVPYDLHSIYSVNQSHSIDFGTIDLDGDSLDHRLTNTIGSNGLPVSNSSYNAPLSPLNPITTSPATPAAFVMNATTGLLSFTPTASGRYITTIETREFRNGVQISSSIRDYEILIYGGAANSFPNLSGVNNTTSYTTSVTACPSASMNFTINSTDADPTDTTEIIVLSKPSGSSFTTNTAQNQIGTFTWNVTPADAQAQAHLLVLEVRDRNCGVRQEIYELYVNNCNTDSVWAGDANADFTCDNYDVLNIGIANGSTGTVRPFATTSWQAEWCPLWTNSFTSNINYKHADCDGDGTVGNADLAAVTANYGMVHQKTSKIGQYKTLGLPDLYCDMSSVQANKGATVTIPVLLGTIGSAIDDFYGIAATVELLNAQTSAPISVSKNVSWIGNASNSFEFDINLASNKSAFTFVRNDQQNLMNQLGQIGEINFPIDVASVTGSKVVVQFSDIKMIKNNGEEITDYNVLSDTLEILAPNAVRNLTNVFEARIFPNPNKGNLTLSINVDKTATYSFTLYDAVGRKIRNNSIQMTLNQGQHAININMADKTAGQYFLELKTDGAKKVMPVQKW